MSKFLSICFRIKKKKTRVQGVLKRHHASAGKVASETRGGDRSAKFTPRHVAICKFIESLQCSEPHYCRSKISACVYLPSELNIRKL